MSEEQFQELYKNTKKEEIIKELFYKCNANYKLHSIIKEAREEIRILVTNSDIADYQAQKLLNILDKVEEKI